MKTILTIALAFLCLNGYTQKLTEYKASNGVTYHLRDTIKLGRGSGQDGWFVYMLASMMNTSDSQRDWFKRKFTNAGVILKNIEVREVAGIKKYEFIVGGGAMYNFHLNIEEAISSCEVLPCSQTVNANLNKFDQIKKIKELLDSGALTQSEFDEQKKKLLNN